MNDALKTWNRAGVLSFNTKHQVNFHNIGGSSQVKMNMNIMNQLFGSLLNRWAKAFGIGTRMLLAKRIIMGVWKAKWKKLSQSCKWSLDKRKSYNQNYARSSDCHAIYAHRAISIWKLSNGTSGGAFNLVAHEDLEHFWGGSSLEYTTQVL